MPKPAEVRSAAAERAGRSVALSEWRIDHPTQIRPATTSLARVAPILLLLGALA